MACREHRLVFKNIDVRGYTRDITCYQKHGGYEILKKGLAMGGAAIRDEVKKSQLRGRGGAGGDDRAVQHHSQPPRSVAGRYSK